MSKARSAVRTSATESANPEWEPIGRRLVSIRGSRTQPEMAALLGVAKTTYGRLERGVRELGADVLTRLQGEGWNANWVLTGAGPERIGGAESLVGLESHGVSGEHLSIAVELADEALKGLWLPRNRYYELVALIYDGLTQGLPYAEIIDFARPAATKLAKERDDDGGTEVGGSREADPAGRQTGGDD